MTFLPIPGLNPAEASCSVDGDYLFLASRDSLRAFDLGHERLIWETRIQAPAPKYYQVPRRLLSTGSILCCGRNSVALLVDTQSGVAIRSFEKASGRLLWETAVPTPPPLPWTEKKRACEGARTEELDAFLGAYVPDRFTLVISRTSRRSTHWLASSQGGGHYPAPPFQAQLEVHGLDENGGKTEWKCSLAGVGVPILEKARFQYVVRQEKEIVSVDPQTGTTAILGKTPKPCCWPRVLGTGVFSAWRTPRDVGVVRFGKTQKEELGRTSIDRKNTREVALHVVGNALLLQFNERACCLVQSDLGSGPEISIKGYIYGVTTSSDGLLFIATAGHGGGVYALNPSSGKLIADHIIPQGAWQIVDVPAAEKAAAVCGPGVAVLDIRSGKLRMVELDCAASIAGVVGPRVAVLTGEPAASGIHLLPI